DLGQQTARRLTAGRADHESADVHGYRLGNFRVEQARHDVARDAFGGVSVEAAVRTVRDHHHESIAGRAYRLVQVLVSEDDRADERSASARRFGGQGRLERVNLSW